MKFLVGFLCNIFSSTLMCFIIINGMTTAGFSKETAAISSVAITVFITSLWIAKNKRRIS